jgi:hypothetical protein
MALTELLTLRKPRSGCLEERAAQIQQNANSFPRSQPRVPAVRRPRSPSDRARGRVPLRPRPGRSAVAAGSAGLSLLTGVSGSDRSRPRWFQRCFARNDPPSAPAPRAATRAPNKRERRMIAPVVSSRTRAVRWQRPAARRDFSPPLCEKGIQRSIGVITEQPTGECLGAANNLVDRPDTDLPTIELHDDLAASLETDCLAKLCQNAEAARLRNPGKYA